MNCTHQNAAIIHNDAKVVIKWCNDCGAINIHYWGERKPPWNSRKSWGRS